MRRAHIYAGIGPNSISRYLVVFTVIIDVIVVNILVCRCNCHCYYYGVASIASVVATELPLISLLWLLLLSFVDYC